MKTPFYATPAMPSKPSTFREGPDGLEKRCSSCREWWPADTVFFTRHEVRPGGLAYQCKACSVQPRPRTPTLPVPLASVAWLGSQHPSFFPSFERTAP